MKLTSRRAAQLGLSAAFVVLMASVVVLLRGAADRPTPPIAVTPVAPSLPGSLSDR